MAIFGKISEDEGDVSPPKSLPRNDDTIPTFDPPKVEPLISLHSLTGLSAPQTLNLLSYIKHLKSIILIDSGSPIILFIVRFIKRPFSISI